MLLLQSFLPKLEAGHLQFLYAEWKFILHWTCADELGLIFQVESTLMKHPGVSAAAVVGVPDQRLNEVVVAFIRLQENWHWNPPGNSNMRGASLQVARQGAEDEQVFSGLDLRLHCERLGLSRYTLPTCLGSSMSCNHHPLYQRADGIWTTMIVAAMKTLLVLTPPATWWLKVAREIVIRLKAGGWNPK